MGKIVKKKKKIKIERETKICVLCEKPHKARTQLCHLCNRKSVALGELLPKSKYYSGKASIAKLVWLKEKYKTNDIFSLIENNLSIYWDGSAKKTRAAYKNEIRAHHRSDEYMKVKYTKWQNDVPTYIIAEMKKHTTKKLITLTGERINPNVHYVCLACNEEHSQKFNDLRNNKGHSCISKKSSGEIIVEEYLKNFVKIKTQYDTLKCVNPITKRIMPYDIEISEHKVVVEVQGEQHLRYIEYFHGSIENFYYQQRKDAYKKAYAEKAGYTMIYIYYNELKDGTYINKLNFLDALKVARSI